MNVQLAGRCTYADASLLKTRMESQGFDSASFAGADALTTSDIGWMLDHPRRRQSFPDYWRSIPKVKTGAGRKLLLDGGLRAPYNDGIACAILFILYQAKGRNLECRSI